MPNYLSTIPAPDANLAAADMTSNFNAFEARTYNLIMNHQPGMMYWNGGDGDDDKKPENKESSKSRTQKSNTFLDAMLNYGASDEASYISYTVDVVSKTPWTGYVQTGVSLANNLKLMFVDNELTTEEFSTALFFDGMGIFVPTAPAYKQAHEYMKGLYMEIDSRLNSIEWWGVQYGY